MPALTSFAFVTIFVFIQKFCNKSCLRFLTSLPMTLFEIQKERESDFEFRNLLLMDQECQNQFPTKNIIEPTRFGYHYITFFLLSQHRFVLNRIELKQFSSELKT